MLLQLCERILLLLIAKQLCSSSCSAGQPVAVHNETQKTVQVYTDVEVGKASSGCSIRA
jgi:hypothetical protein